VNEIFKIAAFRRPEKESEESFKVDSKAKISLEKRLFQHF
jgi:hypothetical protein